MSTNFLFVFEGARSEDLIVKSMERAFFKDQVGVKCVYGGEIYQLYKEIKADPDLDLFTILKGRSEKNKEILLNFSRDSFAEIYLFFDYDGHASLAGCVNRFGQSVASGDEKIAEMLTFFDNETDHGKLYLSYPMSEAIKHVEDMDSFVHLTAKCKGKNCLFLTDCCESIECTEGPSYKEIVRQRSLSRFNEIHRFSWEEWSQVITMHLKKMTYIIHDHFDFPESVYSQSEIFYSQLEKYILKKCPEVSVLSAFPVFFHDYFGNKKTKEILVPTSISPQPE